MIFNKKNKLFIAALLFALCIKPTYPFAVAQIFTQAWTVLSPAYQYVMAALGVDIAKNQTNSVATHWLQQYVNDVKQQLHAEEIATAQATLTIVAEPATSSVTSTPAIITQDVVRSDHISPVTVEQVQAFAQKMIAISKPTIKVIPQEQGFIASLHHEAYFASKFKMENAWTTQNPAPGVTRYQHDSGVYAQIEAKPPIYTLGNKIFDQEVHSLHKHFNLIRTSPEYGAYIEQKINRVLKLTHDLASERTLDRARAFFELNGLRCSWWVQQKIDPLVREINNLVTNGRYELTSVSFESNLRTIYKNFVSDVSQKNVDRLVKALHIPGEIAESLTSRMFRFKRSCVRWYPNQYKIFENPTNQKLIQLIDACDRYDMHMVQQVMQQLPENKLAQQIYREFQEQYHTLLYTKDGIYRSYENDPLWQTMSVDQKNKVINDPQKLEQFNNELTLRHLIKEQVAKAWHISAPTVPSVQQTLYKIISDPTLLGNPLKFSKFLAQEAVLVPANEYESWMKAFFFRNGAVVDFANWPVTAQYAMPLSLHKQENAHLRHLFNHALHLINTNHKYAPNAQQIICYLDRALSTSDSQLASAYQTLALTLEKGINQNISPLVAMVPNFTTSYSHWLPTRIQELLVKAIAHLLQSQHMLQLAKSTDRTFKAINETLRSFATLVKNHEFELSNPVVQDAIRMHIQNAAYDDTVKMSLLNELDDIKAKTVHHQQLGYQCGADTPEMTMPKPVDLPWDDETETQNQIITTREYPSQKNLTNVVKKISAYKQTLNQNNDKEPDDKKKIPQVPPIPPVKPGRKEKSENKQESSSNHHINNAKPSTSTDKKTTLDSNFVEIDNSKQKIDNINQDFQAVFKDGYYEVNGFRFSKYYYERLWDKGRGAPSLVVKEILEKPEKILSDSRPGFMKYEAHGWELVYNPLTREVWHLQPIKK